MTVAEVVAAQHPKGRFDRPTSQTSAVCIATTDVAPLDHRLSAHPQPTLAPGVAFKGRQTRRDLGHGWATFSFTLRPAYVGCPFSEASVGAGIDERVIAGDGLFEDARRHRDFLIAVALQYGCQLTWNTSTL